MSLYNQRGVSAQKEDVHLAIANMSKGLYNNSFCKILPDYLANDDAYCNIVHADTAGTKSVLAYLYWKQTGDLSVWKNVAQDALVMNIDDMLCSGATTNFVLSSTIARNKHVIPGQVISAIITGCNELIQEWRNYGIHIHHAGGETADVGDLVRTIDVGYTAVARLPKHDVVTIAPQVGNVIVGLASYGQATYEHSYNSGIGCNGLTSARHDVLSKYYDHTYPESYNPAVDETIRYIGNYNLTDVVDGHTIGNLLLSPTRTYAPIIQQVLALHRQAITGIVHCTGGGATKCMKYIPQPLHILKDTLIPPPLIFQLIQQASKVSDEEMYQVFNMGQRLEVYTDATTAQAIINIAAQFNVHAQVIGRFEASNNLTLSITTPAGNSFTYNTV